MREWLRRLNDPTRDVYERRYRLLSALGIALMTLWVAVSALVNPRPIRLGFFLACGVLFVAAMAYTLRTGKIQFGAGLGGFVLVFVMVPFAFFNNGGIYAGTPNWCLIALVFVAATVRGRLRNILLASDVIVTCACYAIAVARPSLVATHTMRSAYFDSLSSLAVTAILTSATFLFQLHMSQQERDRLEAQQAQVLDLSRAQNRFFSSMSHEIRTPVNTIVGLNEMILREDVSDEVAEDALQVRAAGRMLLHLVNDILDMSKLESGRMELAEARYDLGEVLSDVVDMMAPQAHEKELAFYVDVDPSLPRHLVGDDVRLRQVLVNIMGNAVKYTEAGSVSLHVQGRRRDETTLLLSISVTDTGTGIRKEDIPDLFSAFRRAGDERVRHIEGTGLGLAIVAQLVELMGGSVSVDSVYTKGSTFLVELPQGMASQEQLGETSLGRQRPQGQQGYRASFQAPDAHVLVVDDNEANLMVAAKLLRATNMEVDVARSGEEALSSALDCAYDLILMDHLMPHMDGIECLHRLRAQAGGLCHNTPVVALTAHAGADARRLYAREGFAGYLAKPYTGEELERTCAELLADDLVRRRQDDEIAVQSVSWMVAHVQRVETVVSTDSIADLPDELVQANHLVVIPHSVRTAEGVFLDGQEIDSNGVVTYQQRGRAMVRTEAPSVEAYEAFFADLLQRAHNVVHVSISGEVAGSGYAAACEAAAAFAHVTVVDSRHLSSGQGLVALEASRLARNGSSPQQIAQILDGNATQIHTSFVVDGLVYLGQAGLVGPRVARTFESLMLHPILRMRKGRIRVGGLLMGGRSIVWHGYVASELRRRGHIDRSLLFVTYVGLEPHDLDEIATLVKELVPFERVVFQKASPAIAASCGPGTFGLIYRTSED